MSLGAAQYQQFILKQPASAVSKTVVCRTGWRPEACRVTVYAADAGAAYAIDTAGYDEAAITKGPTEKRRPAGILNGAVAGGLKDFKDDAASAAVGTDGITFFDRGVKIGQDTDIMKVNSAIVVVECFRSANGAVVVDLSKSREDRAATDGEQYKGGEAAVGDLSDLGVTVETPE